MGHYSVAANYGYNLLDPKYPTLYSNGSRELSILLVVSLFTLAWYSLYRVSAQDACQDLIGQSTYCIQAINILMYGS